MSHSFLFPRFYDPKHGFATHIFHHNGYVAALAKF